MTQSNYPLPEGGIGHIGLALFAWRPRGSAVTTGGALLLGMIVISHDWPAGRAAAVMPDAVERAVPNVPRVIRARPGNYVERAA